MKRNGCPPGAKRIKGKCAKPILESSEWVMIHIPYNKKQTHTKIMGLENRIIGQGVGFDRGSPAGKKEEPIGRDWQLNWSLQGATPGDIIKILDSLDIDYKKYKYSKDDIKKGLEGKWPLYGGMVDGVPFFFVPEEDQLESGRIATKKDKDLFFEGGTE